MQQRSALVFSYRVFARAVGAALQALCFVVLARQLGADGFGAVAVGIAVGAVVSILTGLGGGTRALRLGFEAEHLQLATGMFVSRCVGSLMSAAISYGVITALLDQEWWMGVAVAAIVASEALCGLEQAVLAGMRRQLASAGLLLFQRASPFACIVVGNLAGLPGIASYSVGAAIAAIPAIARPIREWHGPVRLKMLISTSRGYWFANIVECLGMLDTVIVRIFGGGIAAGMYSIANRVTNPIHIVTTSILSTVIPAASLAQRPEQVQILRRCTKLCCVGAAIFASASPVIAEMAARILGPEYAEAKMLIIGFVVAAAISGISQTLVARYLVEGRPATIAIRVGSGITLGLIVTLIAATTDWSRWLWICPIVMQVGILLLLALNRPHHTSRLLDSATSVPSQRGL
jgi:O-antigen/teichoic acid export membrane protein